MERPRPGSSKPHARGRGLIEWALYCLAAPVAGLAAVAVNSALAGHRAMGALQGFGAGAALVALLALVLTPAPLRHRFFPRLLLGFSAVSIAALFALRAKVSELAGGGQATAPLATGPAFVVLLVQAGLAGFYLLRSRSVSTRAKATPAWWSWAPALAFLPLFLIASLAGNHSAGPASGSPSPKVVAEDSGPGQDEFVRLPDASDYPFATETQRAGADFGADFAHFNTGRRPLVGLSCSTRQWHRRTRIDRDFRGIFDPEAAVDAGQAVLAYPGYVVVGLQAQVDEEVHAVRVQFARLADTGPAMDDLYWSDWIGGVDGSLEVVELGGTGELVLGITGSAGLVLNSVGLLIERDDAPLTAR